MPTEEQIHSIASTLEAYHNQLTALSQALGALREASDTMLLALDKDRVAIATYLEAAPRAAPAIESTVGHSCDSTAIVEASDVVAAATTIDTADAIALDNGPTEPTHETIEDAPAIIEAPVAVEPEITTDAVITTEIIGQHDSEAASGAVAETSTTAEITAEAPTEIVAPLTATEAALTPVIAASTAPETPVTTTTLDAATAGTDSNVVPLDARRHKSRTSLPARRRAMTMVASMVITAGAALGFHELMQTEIGQRLIELSSCDGDMLSASRDCALLAWLML